jgi:hypothetical protein
MPVFGNSFRSSFAERSNGLGGYRPVQRTRIIAIDLLKKSMMKGKTDQEVNGLIGKISSTSGYKSHGAVIDYDEAKAIGLDVQY